MSDKEVKNKQEDTAEEKYVSNYDKKMQRRQAEKARAAKEKKRGRIVGIALLVVAAGFLLSFPIRTAMTLYGTYITVGGEKVTRVEFDYNFNIIYNEYVSSYGSYLSYFGLDTSQDLSTQAYSDTLTWKDYFDEQAVSNLINNRAMKAEADAAGFEYDTDEEYDTYVENVKTAASEAGLTTNEYVKELYGDYATLGRIEDYVCSSIRLQAYYEEVEESKAPADDEIETYYEENPDSYDSIDYYVQIIEAELPTEPTELADTTETTDSTTTDTATDSTTADTTTTDGTTTTDSTTTDTTTEDTEYEPSEAEIEKAMSDAKELADAAVDTVTADGTLTEGAAYSDTPTVTRTWLFDAARAEGDTTVVEDETNNQYYVLSFVQRYRDDTPTVSVRVILDEESDGQAILDEWAAGEATEESFAALADQYNNADYSLPDGGLLEELTPGSLTDQISEWMFADGRAAGDTTAIETDGGYTYVIYYVSSGDPSWKISIRSTLTSEAMSEYMDEITADVTVEDPKGNLNYLAVEASEAAAESESTESTETTESTESTDSMDSTESTEATESSAN